MKPLVSVMFPSYNHEKYVQDTIKSIINQTYENIELIAIDDGSKDSTYQKILDMKDECEKRFKRVIFQTQENEGTSKTLKKLKAMAQGEYILLLASDDMLKPECVEKEVDFLSNNPDYVLCVGDNEFIDAENTVIYWDKKRKAVYDINKAEYKTNYERMKKRRNIDMNSDEFGKYSLFYINNYMPNGFMIKKSVYDTIEYTPEAPLEDWFLMLHLSKYHKMKYINEILYSYRWFEDNTCHDSGRMRELLTKTRKYENKILSELDKSKVNQDILNVINNGVIYYKKGLPHVFEIYWKYRINNKKYIGAKIFNIELDLIEKDL